METIDLRKQLKHLYSPTAKKVELVEAPGFNFIQIDGAIEEGHGPSTSPGFGEAMQALYGAAYTLKFMLKKRPQNPVDYPVMALEGLWWVEDGQFDIRSPGNWRYTIMILQPELAPQGPITQELFGEAVRQVGKKHPSPAVERLRLARFEEGPSLQMMHIGPYAEEMRTIEQIDAYAAVNGYQLHGKHHEIYMGDPRRGDPAKMKTILRHPVRVMPAKSAT